MLVLEFVGSVSLYQVARVTDCKVGSSVCEASSSVFFNERVPYGMSVAGGRERGLSWLLTRCSLTCRDFQKGIEK